MISLKTLQFYTDFLNAHHLKVPDIHIVLGSGFGESLNEISKVDWQLMAKIHLKEIPEVSPPTVMDHSGQYLIFQNKKQGTLVQFQLGRLHGYEGHSPRSVIKPVMIPRLAGVKEFILTNAAGGMTPTMKPGDVMMIQDHVNLTGQNPLIGDNPTFNQKSLGPRFPDLSKMYKNGRSEILYQSLQQKAELGVHKGIYLGLLGPSFETPAEIQLFKQWGMGAVGMSTVWEAIALHHSGAQTTGLSLISNLAAGLSEEELDHHLVLKTCRQSAHKIMEALFETL